MAGQIKKVYRVSEVHEVSIDFNGNNYLTIFGKHINGWFITIPNWHVSCEACCPTDTFYNTEKLSECLMKKPAKAIAEAIRNYWIMMEEKRNEAAKEANIGTEKDNEYE